MNYILFISDSLTGEEKIVNRFFTSEQEAQQYCADNDLIFSRVLSEQQYQGMVQNYQNQKFLRQQYSRYPQPQQQYQNERMIHELEEPKESEPLPQQRPVKPVGIIFRPRFAQNLRFNPLFIGRRKVR